MMWLDVDVVGGGSIFVYISVPFFVVLVILLPCCSCCCRFCYLLYQWVSTWRCVYDWVYFQLFCNARYVVFFIYVIYFQWTLLSITHSFDGLLLGRPVLSLSLSHLVSLFIAVYRRCKNANDLFNYLFIFVAVFVRILTFRLQYLFL